MAIFQSAGRQAFKPHVHVAEEQCPWCEQPISHAKFEDIRRRMTAEQNERLAAQAEEFARKEAAAEAKAKAAIEQARAETAAAAEQRVQAARNEATQAAETRLAATQAKLAEVEQAKAAALQEARESSQKERDAAVLAEKAKVLKLQSELQDMQRKLEGKSANELGEGSEIDLFEQLKATFENLGDTIDRVPKGVNGADVIHVVKYNGKVCGKIVYDAKNRNAWQNEFVTKLRADKIAQGADHAILSSNKFPRDKAQVHYQDGVIVAQPARVAAIVQVLRDQVVRMHELRISKEGREQKSVEIYAFITSEHCKQLLDQVDTQAGRMLELDTKEQEAHRRLWDQRKKLINSVQKARSDLVFEIDRIIGTAGNGPEA